MKNFNFCAVWCGIDVIREIKMVLDHHYKVVPGESGINIYDFEMKLGRNELVSRRYRVS